MTTIDKTAAQLEVGDTFDNTTDGSRYRVEAVKRIDATDIETGKDISFVACYLRDLDYGHRVAFEWDYDTIIAVNAPQKTYTVIGHWTEGGAEAIAAVEGAHNAYSVGEGSWATGILADSAEAAAKLAVEQMEAALEKFNNSDDYDLIESLIGDSLKMETL